MFLCIFDEQKKEMHIFMSVPICPLIRQYLPKGTNFKDITDKDLALIVKELNHRPRKCLNYHSPHEVIYSAIHGALAT
jgi:hypothetical protein